ncbi:MAG: hypothetical protein MZV70_52010 [Desulfobacterales bacterium]|nr:hypothetical protein [Desulfobacterales bacterium]
MKEIHRKGKSPSAGALRAVQHRRLLDDAGGQRPARRSGSVSWTGSP